MFRLFIIFLTHFIFFTFLFFFFFPFLTFFFLLFFFFVSFSFSVVLCLVFLSSFLLTLSFSLSSSFFSSLFLPFLLFFFLFSTSPLLFLLSLFSFEFPLSITPNFSSILSRSDSRKKLLGIHPITSSLATLTQVDPLLSSLCPKILMSSKGLTSPIFVESLLGYFLMKTVKCSSPRMFVVNASTFSVTFSSSLLSFSLFLDPK